MKPARRSGFTLTEVLVATTISTIVLFGIITLDMARVQMSEQTKEQGGIRSPDRQLAGVAAMHMSRRLEQADRVRIVAVNGMPGIQLRRPVMKVAGCTVGVPGPDCFDQQQNYEWDQYSMRSGGRLMFFENGCQANSSRQLTNQNIVFAVSLTNNNKVTYSLTWTHPQTGVTMRFPGEVTIRGSTTDVGTGLEAPGLNVSAPPIPCS